MWAGVGVSMASSRLSFGYVGGSPPRAGETIPSAKTAGGSTRAFDGQVIVDIEKRAKEAASRLTDMTVTFKTILQEVTSITGGQTAALGEEARNMDSIVDASIASSFALVQQAEDLDAEMEKAGAMAQQIKDLRAAVDGMEELVCTATALSPPAEMDPEEWGTG